MNKSTHKQKPFEKVHLSDASIEQTKQIITSIRIVMSNLRLYPPSSQTIIKSNATTYAIIAKFIEENDILVFSHSSNNILVNGTPIITQRLVAHERFACEQFLNMMVTTHIKSLSFKKGLTSEELKIFLTKLTDKDWRREGDLKILTDLLRKEGIHDIGINEWEYEAVGESDLVLEKAKDYIGKKGTSLDELMKSLDEVSGIYSLTDDVSMREQSRTAIVEKLIKVNPRVFINFFHEKCEDNIENIKQEIISGLPADRLKEVVINIARLYRELEKEIPYGDEKEHELVKLRKAINSLLCACKDKNIFMEICNELRNMDLKELVPIWWQKEELSELELIVSQAKLLIEKDSLSILEEDAQQNLPKIFRELDVINRVDLMKGLIDKIIQNLDANVSGIRFRNAVLIKKIIPAIESLKNKNELQSLYENILSTVDHEPDIAVYNELSDTLIRKVTDYLKIGDYETSEKYINIYRKHRRKEYKGFLQRPHCADKVMSTIVNSEITNILVNDLETHDHEKRKKVMRIIAQFEDLSAPALIKAIKEIQDYSIRNNVALLIKYLGETIASQLLEELNIEHSETALQRIIEILPTIDLDELVLNQLKTTIHHPNKQIRIVVVRTVARLKINDKIGDVLLPALNDKEEYIKREIMNILGNLKYTPAAEKFLIFIKVKSIFHKEDFSNMIQQAACTSLGKISNNKNIYPLIRLAKSYPWYTFKRTKNELVRISAVMALKNFDISEKNINQTLLKLKKDKTPYIRAAVESILTNTPPPTHKLPK